MLTISLNIKLKPIEATLVLLISTYNAAVKPTLLLIEINNFIDSTIEDKS